MAVWNNHFLFCEHTFFSDFASWRKKCNLQENIFYEYTVKKIITILLLFNALACFGEEADYLVGTLQRKDGLSDNRVLCLCTDEMNRLLIGTRGGLNIYDGTSVRCVGNSDLMVSALLCSDNDVYVGAENGLYIYNASTDSLKHVDALTRWSVGIYCPVNSICKCGNILAVGTEGQGLFLLDLSSGVLKQHSVNMNFVSDVAVINDNSIIVSAGRDGVFSVRLADMTFNRIQGLSSLHSLTYALDRVWGVNSDGVAGWIDKDYVFHPVQRYALSVSAFDATHVLVTSSDALHIIASDGTLSHIWHCCNDSSRIADFQWGGVGIFDKEGNLWMPTESSGVVRLPAKKMKVRKGQHLDSAPDPRQCSDKEGNTYKAVRNHVFRYDVYGKTTAFFVAHMTPLVLYCDMDGVVWTGTRENGLRRNFKTVELCNVDAQPFCVYSVKQDIYGYLWIACNLGIARVNPADMSTRVIAGPEILPQAETFIPDSSPMTSDGAVRFITTNLTFELYPADYISEDDMQPASISRVVLRNSSKNIWYPDTRELHIPYSENGFTVYLTMTSYVRPQENRYSCMLEGVDKSMSAWSRQNSVTYSGLAPGRYQFHVKGMRGDGVESSNLSSYVIVVDPLWWNSKTAIVCYVLLGIMLLMLLVAKVISTVRKHYSAHLSRDRKQIEEDSYKQRMNFFLGMVHEIRTPMTMMKLSLDRLSGVAPKERAAVNLINENLDYINETINGILNYNNNESEGTKLLIVRTDLAGMCREIIQHSADMAKLKNLKLFSDIPEQPVYIMADEIFFSKIIGNLISNAMKYARTTIKMSLAVQDGRALLRVDDDGPGVNPNEKDKIFDMFYKVSGDKVAEASGMGIGLAYSKQLAIAHNATLEQENLPDGGASFILGIQVVESVHVEGKSRLSQPVQNEASNSNAVVLVVEDNPSLRAMLEEELSAWFDVQTASNGAEAMTLLESNPVDVIISDVMMPVMDGLELCREVKGRQDYSHIPFIMLTAKVSVQAKAEGLGSGADAYVEKPFSIAQIKAQIENLLRFREACRHEVMASAGTGEPASSNYVNRLDREFLDKIDEIIESQIKEESFSIDALADEMCMSKSNFYRKFHAVTGSSPNEYLKNFRLNRAAKLITEGAKINEAAISVGFYSSSYFAKCFYAKFGVLPKDYVNR